MLIFMVVRQNHGHSRKLRHTTKITVKATSTTLRGFDSERIEAVLRIDRMLILGVANIYRSVTSHTQMRNV